MSKNHALKAANFLFSSTTLMLPICWVCAIAIKTTAQLENRERHFDFDVLVLATTGCFSAVTATNSVFVDRIPQRDTPEH